MIGGDSASRPDRLKKSRDLIPKAVDNRIGDKLRQYLEKGIVDDGLEQ